MLWYSLEAPPQGASNEYPQHMFLLRSKEIISSVWTEFLEFRIVTGLIISNYSHPWYW